MESLSMPSAWIVYQFPDRGRLAVQRLYPDREGLPLSCFIGKGAKSVKIPLRTVAKASLVTRPCQARRQSLSVTAPLSIFACRAMSKKV